MSCVWRRGSDEVPTEAPVDTNVPCPHCQRTFAPKVAERHIPACATTRARPKPPCRRHGDAAASPTPPPRPAASPTPPPVAPGARVVLQGLSAAALNGQVGRLDRYDPASGRWHVKLGEDVKAIRPANLTPLP